MVSTQAHPHTPTHPPTPQAGKLSLRSFGTVASKNAIPVGSAFEAGTVYGGHHTVTLIPGDGIGQEMAKAVKTVFQAANVPVNWEQFDLSGDVLDPGLLKQAMYGARDAARNFKK